MYVCACGTYEAFSSTFQHGRSTLGSLTMDLDCGALIVDLELKGRELEGWAHWSQSSELMMLGRRMGSGRTGASEEED
jgi:hypothetical protein